jgi:MFS family permease
VKALSPWRFVVAFGVVAMLADVVYEGARSVAGPFLASLGATGVVVGVVTGAGEAAALGLRLVTGPLVDRTGRPWRWTVAGYALTVVSVPLLAFAGPLWTASGLLIAERTGKAVRSPAKDSLLAGASTGIGRGRAFAVHEALDQIGAFAGPLLVAGAVAVTGGFRAGFAVLALPGVAVLVLLAWLVRRVPDPSLYETVPHAPATARAGGTRLPAAFRTYAAFTALTMLAYPTFGLLGYHLATRHLVPVAAVPLVYALAMGVDALAALAVGPLYDRYGRRVLAVLPVLVAAVPALAFARTLPAVLVGAVLWGAAMGVQESTMRAAVAELVPPARRGTAYGVFGAVYGLAWFAGSTALGASYDRSVPATIAFVVTVQIAALVLLLVTTRGGAAGPGSRSPTTLTEREAG